MRKFVLASKSPRRKELLGNIGIKFNVIEGDVDESIVPKSLEPKMYVQELAVLKANSSARKAGRHALVIGADTVVVRDGEVLGKPADLDEAFDMLKSLSGKTHCVYTGIAVLDTDSMKIVSDYEKTSVTFRELSDGEIDYYVKSYRPTDKAGAYGIQEFAGVFVSNIEGDYFNIVGLPVCRLYTLIKEEFGEEL